MSIEQRKGRLYLYGARRVRGRIVKQYRGPLTTQIPTQTGADAKRPGRTRSAEVLTGQAFCPIESAPAFSRPSDSVTLRGFEPRSQP